MGDGVRDMAHAIHQLLDAVQHSVDVIVETGEFVAARRRRDAPFELPALDPGRRVADGGEAPLDAVMKEQSATGRHQRRQDETGHQGPQHQPSDLLLVGHVTADHQNIAIGQPGHQDAGARRPAETQQRLVGQLPELSVAPVPRRDIADDPGAARVHQQIDLGIGSEAVIEEIADLAPHLGAALSAGKLVQPARERDQLTVDAARQLADRAVIEGRRHHQHRRHHRQAVEKGQTEGKTPQNGRIGHDSIRAI